MAVIKCKMCGGDLNITEGLSVAECEYCGSRQTIPSADNEKKMTLFTRAAKLLRGCEFDKASGIFETIVADFPEEAEAYWGLVLCKYGIEYVDDPATGKKVPTCHRSSFDSVMKDANYEQACENTDAVARRVYRDEARQIEELRKAIIEVSGKEEPYDVFISYKETDEKGQRTLDSVIAQDIYKELSREGYRVFFSRISLEGKLGVEYEPYIFAALNSAKVMLVVGTDYEHFDAVWVKNEWSRFLKLIASGGKKVLIPVFKDMDAYDMPEEFAKLAAQDMGKLGAMQDILHAVEKIIGGRKEEPKEEKRETVIVQQGGGPNVTALLKRGEMALQDGKWDDAKNYYDRVLDMDAECAEAYLGLFLVENECSDLNEYVEYTLEGYEEDISGNNLIACEPDEERIRCITEENHVPVYLEKEQLSKLFAYDRTYYSLLDSRKAQLEDAKACLDEDKNFERACKFASGSVAETINSAKDRLFAKIQELINKDSAEDLENIARVKAEYAEHLDKAETEAKRLREEAEAQREKDYLEVCALAESATTAAECFSAARKFQLQKFKGYKDSDEKSAYYINKSNEIKAALNAANEAEQKRLAAKKKKIAIILSFLALLAVAAVLIYTMVIIPGNEYKFAEKLLAAEKYDEAIVAFEALGEYKDSADRALEAAYIKAEELLAAEKYDEAIVAFEALGEYKDALQRADESRPLSYTAAEKMLADGKYARAGLAYARSGDYEDARAKCFDAWAKAGLLESISAGHDHSVGLKSDGTVVAVGRNGSGQCKVSGWTDIVAISAGGWHSVGLKADSTVVAVGDNGSGRCDVSGWRDIVAISAGSSHTVGLKADGTVVAVGYNGYGQCDVSGWTDIVAVSAGDYHTVGLKSDGTVVSVGYNEYDQCDVSGWTDIVAVSAGYEHTVGLKSDGTVVAVGYNKYGRCNVSDWTDIVAISAGSSHTVGLKADGTVVAVGDNYYGRCDVSDWRDIVAVSAGDEHSVGLKSDGTVVAVGSNYYGPCDVSGWRDIRVPEV